MSSLVPSNRGVNVEIGNVRRAGARRAVASMCIVGIAPWDSPWLAQLYPNNIIRRSGSAEDGAHYAVEQVRLSAASSADSLPGLLGSQPSLIRDGVTLAFSAGMPQVDVLLARGIDMAPWDLDRPDILDLLDPFLYHMPGAALAYPDLHGPVPVGPGTGKSTLDRILRTVKAVNLHASRWTERFQVGCVDLVDAPNSELKPAMERMIGTDTALVRWHGREERIRCHGWRSGAAFLAAILGAAGDQIAQPLTGRKIPLPGGRRTSGDRRLDLHLRPTSPVESPYDNLLVTLGIHRARDEVTILTESTMRRPVGHWPLPALRTVKMVHQRIKVTSESLSFAHANQAHAMALKMSLQDALWPLFTRGILSAGPGGGPPEVEGGVVLTPGQPSLTANLTAQLIPWQRDVQVRVSLSPGSQPNIEVT